MVNNNIKGYLLFALLGGIIVWLIWGQPRIEVDVKAYELQIQLLEKKIDSINSQNTALKSEADSLNVKLVEYDDRINKLNTKIYVIKQETNKRLDAVDSFGDDELERFFAKRYRQHKDSIN